MSGSDQPPWKHPELLAAFDTPAPWGYLGQGEEGIEPRGLESPRELCERMVDGEPIDIVWSPASRHLQTAYQPDELERAVVERDRQQIDADLVETRKPSAALLIAVVAGGAWWASGHMQVSVSMLMLAIIGLVHLLETGPLQAWAASSRRRQLDSDPGGYRARRDAAIRFSIWQSRHGRPTTIFLCTCLGICFFLQMQVGLADSHHLTGLVKPLVAAGEWWRLLTAAFVHGSPMHILFNGFVLLALGALMERSVGPGRMLCCFLVGSLGSSLMSWWLMPQAASVGASGGILALGGCLLACAWLRPELKEIGIDRMLLRWSLILVVIGLVGAGFIDNAGHLGGWLTGMALAPLLAPRRGSAYPAAGDELLKYIGMVATVAVAGWTCWLMRAAF